MTWNELDEPAPTLPELAGRVLTVRASRVTALRRAARGNPLITTGALIVLLIFVAAVFAPLLAPYPADAGSATHPENALLAPSMASRADVV